MSRTKQQSVKRGAFLLSALAVLAAPAFADCKGELEQVDRLLIDAESERPQLYSVLKVMRDQGAAACEAGDETGAGAAFKSITMMLGIDPDPPKAPPSPPAKAHEEVQTLEFQTVYISSKGEGILRYTVPDGAEGVEYTFVSGGLTGDPRQPIETLGSDGARFTGPHIARYIWGLTGQGMPIEKFVLTLGERDPFRPIAYFKFVVDDARAEPVDNCGEVNPKTDECSIKQR